MTSSFDTQDPIEPMTVGNVVNTGFRLYTTNWKPYLQVAAIATLWAIVPWLLLLPLAVLFLSIDNSLGLLALVVPAWLVLFLVCAARYLSNSAAISRLSFNELTHQPESPSQAQRFTGSRKWSFILLNVLIGLIFTVILVVLYIVAAICIAAILAAMGGLEFLMNPTSAAAVNPTLIVLSILILLGVVLIVILAFVWFGVRFAIADLPLAVEPQISATDAINRSWELTRNNVWRIFLVLTVTTIIAFPLQAIAQVLGTTMQEVLTAVLPNESAPLLIFSAILGTIISLLISIVLLPLWQSMKAVIYYDLRSRREGIDIALRDVSDRLPPA